jgi:hypothetical protein
VDGKNKTLIHVLVLYLSFSAKMSSPWSNYYLVRNPRYTNKGKFLKFTEFLEHGKNKDLSGIMVIIEVILPPFTT